MIFKSNIKGGFTSKLTKFSLRIPNKITNLHKLNLKLLEEDGRTAVELRNGATYVDQVTLNLRS